MFHRKSEKIVSSRTSTLNGKNFSYKLIQSPNARTVRLKVGMHSGLEIIVPRRFHLDHVEEIFAEHEQWIIKQIGKLENRKKLREQRQLQDGSMLTVLGFHCKIKIIENPRKKPSVKKVQKLLFTEENAIVDGMELHVSCDGTIRQAKEALEDYLRTVAEKYFLKRTTDLAEQMGVTFNNITIRGQKTRWGSCTREKNLNFNWRLILLPLEVAESVIIHELAHTIHMNHSKSFYGLVERFCPDYRKLQKHLHNPQFLV